MIKRKLRVLVSAALCLSILMPVGVCAADVWDTVKEAYVFSFPLVLMDVSKANATNTVDVDTTKNRAPVNQFFHAKTLATAQFRQVVTPNVDTLYSQLFMDLSEDALVIHKPAADRFFSLEIMDAWSDCVTVLGTGGKDDTEGERTYLLTGPNFNGTVPEGMKQVKVPTSIGWILGRTVCFGDSDLNNVYAIQDKLTSKTLTAYLTGSDMPKGTYNPVYDYEDYGRKPITYALSLGAEAFFGLVNELLVNNPGYVADAPVLERLKEINVGAGLTFDASILDDADGEKWNDMKENVHAGLVKSVRDAGYSKKFGAFEFFGEPIAEFGTAYDYRALIAIDAFGANPVYIAIYPQAKADDDGGTLNAQNSYVLHFDSVPPVKTHGFWSVTAYGDDNYLIDNELDRYCINDRSGFTLNDDGSLDIYLQSTKPEDEEKVSNWLPSGTAGFHLHMRIYLPGDSSVDGTWTWPTIRKVSEEPVTTGGSPNSGCNAGWASLALLALAAKKLF